VASPPIARRTLLAYPASLVQTEAAAGIGAAYFFRANSIFDPDFTGVGTSALGYAAWNQFYTAYRVTRCTIRLQAQAAGMSTNGLATVAIVPSEAATSLPANKQTWRTMPGSVMKPTTNANTSGTVVSLTTTYDMAKLAKLSRSQFLTDQDYASGFGSSPAKPLFFAVCVDSSGSASPVTVTYNIEITYEVTLFNPVALQ
jgi:hypothetical protein